MKISSDSSKKEHRIFQDILEEIGRIGQYFKLPSIFILATRDQRQIMLVSVH